LANVAANRVAKPGTISPLCGTPGIARPVILRVSHPPFRPSIVVAGKLIADILFYLPTNIGYELLWRRLPTHKKVTP
jgi:hypothetical protein